MTFSLFIETVLTSLALKEAFTGEIVEAAEITDTVDFYFLVALVKLTNSGC